MNHEIFWICTEILCDESSSTMSAHLGGYGGRGGLGQCVDKPDADTAVTREESCERVGA